MALNAFEGTVIAELRRRIAAEMKRHGDVILEGTLKTMEDYKRLVGERKGLGRCLELIDEAEKRASMPNERKAV